MLGNLKIIADLFANPTWQCLIGHTNIDNNKTLVRTIQLKSLIIYYHVI